MPPCSFFPEHFVFGQHKSTASGKNYKSYPGQIRETYKSVEVKKINTNWSNYDNQDTNNTKAKSFDTSITQPKN